MCLGSEEGGRRGWRRRVGLWSWVDFVLGMPVPDECVAVRSSKGKTENGDRRVATRRDSLRFRLPLLALLSRSRSTRKKRSLGFSYRLVPRKQFKSSSLPYQDTLECCEN